MKAVSYATHRQESSETHSRINFIGYPVDNLSMQRAVLWTIAAARQGRFHHIAVLNANKMWIADRNVRLREIVRRADLVIPEYAVVWGCRMLGTPVKAHIGGIMLLQSLLPSLQAEEIPVYFLGARQDVVESMVSHLHFQYPTLKIAGARSGYFSDAEAEGIVREINGSGARILFVAMGTPRQELWIERHRSKWNIGVAIGVGGSFDVLAGIKKDAPSWLRHGGEWLYRLAQDPRNLWKRYLTTNPWFVAHVLREKLTSCMSAKSR
jgi:N-acetylglucosaminyldiphosphoundecaprenol N-acetyl-beta-D-mannosaminyltransferase